MAQQYIFRTALASIDQQCAIDYKLNGLDGFSLSIPFGFVLPELASAQQSEQQLPHFVSVTPCVFTEPTLDKAQAGAPEYIAMFKEQDTLLEGQAIGYYYVFLNGFLWREVAALANGVLSEVDLAKYHDHDFRAHSGQHVTELKLPVKGRGLLGQANDSLSTACIEIAFSRVQWSWQYIFSLGNMHQQDPRLRATGLTSGCPDAGKAAQYRAERMQKLALDKAPNWSNIENMAIKNDTIRVYVHDILGIAQLQKIDAVYSLNRLAEQQRTLQDNPLYKSALLAHQTYFNEALWEYDLVPMARGRDNIQFKRNDSASNDAREVGEELSAQKLQHCLLGDDIGTLTTLIEDYLRAKQCFLDLHQLQCSAKEQGLAQLCRDNSVQAPGSWLALMRDFATLPAVAYPYAFEFCYDQLLTLFMPNEVIPIFLPALPNKSHKKNLIKKLNALYDQGKSYTQTLNNDKTSWLNVLFMADEALFGDDLTQQAFNEEHISQQLGAFDPRKWTFEARSNTAHSVIMPALFIELRMLQTIEKGFSETITYWQRVFKERTFHEEASELFYTRVGALAKSMNPSALSSITLCDFDKIPRGFIAISGPYVSHPMVKNITSKKGRDAFKRALKAVNSGKAPNANQLITLAREMHMKINPLGAQNSQPNSGSTHPYMAKQVRAELTQMLTEVRDLAGTFKDVRRSGGKVFIIPETEVPPDIIEDHNRLLSPGSPKVLKISNFKKYFFATKKFSSVPLLGLTTLTAFYCYGEYDKEFGGRSGLYKGLKHTAVIGSVIAGIGAVWENYAVSAKNHPLTATRAHSVAKKVTEFAKEEAKFTYLRTFGGAVGALMGGIQIADGLHMINHTDRDAGVMNIMAGSLGMASAIWGAVFVSFGPIGWALFLGSMALSVGAVLLVDSEAEKWVKLGPFAKAPNLISKGINWVFDPSTEEQALKLRFKQPTPYYHFIVGVLFSPQVRVSHVGGQQYLVEVSLPDFVKGQSELELQVQYQLNNPLRAVSGQPIASPTWHSAGISGTQEYDAHYSPQGQLQKAIYTINIQFANPRHLLTIAQVRATPILRYSPELTLPIKYNQEVKEKA
ncbi:hypothetical protein PCIT_a2528 [Pseudoalteromonas citrea]|uniref:Uncharacterized protein n=2 Tax=Pseudoalteromonas citrea TaxID=43655 RepID=A0AAD4FRC0_9GAMM|nr:hypothetical protein [Pseudoalteromonas citrea]KAF7769660.1 hypothetical protein PCIT_a2528 [Pseudoalteromonas citrea]